LLASLLHLPQEVQGLLIALTIALGLKQRRLAQIDPSSLGVAELVL
jgi:hypothetical protein